MWRVRMHARLQGVLHVGVAPGLLRHLPQLHGQLLGGGHRRVKQAVRPELHVIAPHLQLPIQTSSPTACTVEFMLEPASLDTQRQAAALAVRVDMGYHDPNRLKPVSALDPQAGEPGLGAHPLGVQLLQRGQALVELRQVTLLQRCTTSGQRLAC